jgi:hypothetical protein
MKRSEEKIMGLKKKARKESKSFPSKRCNVHKSRFSCLTTLGINFSGVNDLPNKATPKSVVRLAGYARFLGMTLIAQSK